MVIHTSHSLRFTVAVVNIHTRGPPDPHSTLTTSHTFHPHPHLQALHVSDDVCSAVTATPAEAALGSHFALVARSWRDKLPYARALSQPAVKQRHIQMLMAWILVGG